MGTIGTTVARPTASIQAEIDRIEAVLTDAAGTNTSMGDGPTNLSRDRASLERRLDVLYQRLDRASGNSPMFVRGRVKGISHGRV